MAGGTRSANVSELEPGARIEVMWDSVDACSAFDADGDGQVTIDEVILAVASALGNCGG